MSYLPIEHTYDNEKLIFDLITDAFKTDNPLVKHQIDSFNTFLRVGLPSIIEESPTIDIKVKKDKKETGVRYVVHFGQLYIDKPNLIGEDRSLSKVYPNEARLRDLTYQSTVFIDIFTETYTPGKNVETNSYLRYPFFKLPIMLQSTMCNLHGLNTKKKIEKGECRYDLGGYFIVNGKEKVLVSQERANYDSINVYKQKPNKNSKFSHMAEIRSISDETKHSILIQAMIGHDGRNIVFSLPYIDTEISAGIVFKALGYIEEDEILTLISPSSKEMELLVKFIITESCMITNRDKALQYIGQYSMHSVETIKQKEYAEQILENELLPHFGIVSTKKELAIYMGYMIKKLLSVFLNILPEDDKDNMNNKREDVAGVLVEEIVRNSYKKTITNIIQQLEKRPDINLALSLKNTLSKDIKGGFSTGSWGVQKSVSYVKKGVSQLMVRLSYSAYLSHERRLAIQTGKEGKNTKIRQINSSQFGFIDSVETPEGAPSGIVKNFSMFSKVSNKRSSARISDILYRNDKLFPVEDIDLVEMSDMTKVFLNGIWLGFTLEPIELTNEYREWRAKHIIPWDVSIAYRRTKPKKEFLDNELYNILGLKPDATGKDIRLAFKKLKENIGDNIEELHNIEAAYAILKDPKFRQLYRTFGNRINHEGEIHIFCDSGRVLRPLFVVRNNKVLIKEYNWQNLIDSDSIRFIDPSEAEQSIIAMFPAYLNGNIRYDYCEIHPSLMLGICSSIVPYSDHSQAPRNIYSSAMNKQAIGTPITSIPHRVDTFLNVLDYPQKPLVRTIYDDLLGFDKMPYGMNIVVAVMCYNWNQEDSIVLNASSVQRGMFCATTYKTHTIEEKKKTSSGYENICIPPLDKRDSSQCYLKLDKNGIVKVGSILQIGDVMVGKVITKLNKNTGEEEKKDISVVVKSGEEGIVDKIFITTASDGRQLIKIRMRILRIPQIGDKWCSRAGQKGTCGMLFPQEDLPFTQNGIVPDLIINSLAFPSRMTVGMFMEMVTGKRCAIKGERGNATPFTSDSTDACEKITNALKECGFNGQGYEYLTNGMTGETYKAKIFIGPCYYQRLKHLVADKMHARNYGNVQALTRQPTAGRSRDGGLRLGEMEKDALLTSGVAHFLTERLFDMSDPFMIQVCSNCGIPSNNMEVCNMCKSCNIKNVRIPYAPKLLLQYLGAMCLKTKLIAN